MLTPRPVLRLLATAIATVGLVASGAAVAVVVAPSSLQHHQDTGWAAPSARDTGW